MASLPTPAIRQSSMRRCSRRSGGKVCFDRPRAATRSGRRLRPKVRPCEELPIRVLRTGGPYDEAVDLNVSPLAAGQSKPFRLTFENISAQWNHAYPELQITQVSVR